MGEVMLIDLVLAGDNAIVVGLAASAMEPHLRLRVISWGLIAAVILRIGLSLIAVQMLAVVGLTLAGGLLLLWVCWKLYRETVAGIGREDQESAPNDTAASTSTPDHPAPPKKSIHAAIGQIIVADISMSLDNVLAVAGAAREHPAALVTGLILSVALMGVAASIIAPLIRRFPWLSYFGQVVILYVAVEMIYHGSIEVAGAVLTSIP